MIKPTKDEIMKHYAEHKQPTHFIQFDAFDDGEVYATETYEMMNDWARVRVLIPDTISNEDVAEGLRRILASVEHSIKCSSEDDVLTIGGDGRRGYREHVFASDERLAGFRDCLEQDRESDWLCASSDDDTLREV